MRYSLPYRVLALVALLLFIANATVWTAIAIQSFPASQWVSVQPVKMDPNGLKPKPVWI